MTASFLRIVWKEYRTQRTLWLALWGCATLLQLLFLSFSPQMQRASAAYPLLAGFVITVCYVGACAAILFAGEREEETDELLRMLPLSPWLLAAGKLVFAAAAIALFGLLVTTSAAAIWSIAGGPVSDGRMDWPEALSWAASVGLVVFAWILLASLHASRVMVALVVGATCAFVTGITWSSPLGLSPSPVPTVIAAVLLVVDVLLIRVWVARPGTPADWGAARRTGSGEPVPWLRPLTWAASRATAAQRAVGVLLWRELRAAVPFVLLWGLVGMTVIILGQSEMFDVYLMLTPWVCGQMVFAGDQRRQAFRFLADRGVSPAAVWLVKQCVWLVVMLAFVLAGFAYAGGGTYGGVRISVPTFLADLADVSSPWVQDVPGPLFATSLVMLGASLCLALYSVGQLLSLWVRRAILSVSLGLGCFLVVVGAHVLLAQAGVPPSLMFLPLSLAAMAATALMTPGWLRESRSARRQVAQIGGPIVAVVGLVLVTVAHRAWSIPQVEPGFDWRAHERRILRIDRDWSLEWQELVSSLHLFGLLQAPEQHWALMTDLRESLLGWAATLSQEGPVPSLDPRATLGNSVLSIIGSSVATLAEESVVEGELETAWDEFKAALKVIHYLEGQVVSRDDWVSLQRSRCDIHFAIRRWSQAVGQRAELLREAAMVLRDQPAPSPEEMQMNRYVLSRQYFESRGRLWELENEPFLRHDALALFLAAEQERSIRLLNILSQAEHSGATRWDERQLSLWLATTPLMGYVSDLGVTGLIDGMGLQSPGFVADPHDEVQRMSLASQRGTLLVLELERYRLTHGSYPERLEMLLDRDVLNDLPRDPYRGAAFGYAPAGFPAPVIVSVWDVVPPGQPLLWSRGPDGGELIYQRPPMPDEATSAAIERRLYWASNVHPQEKDVESLAERLSSLPAADGNVSFIILGLGRLGAERFGTAATEPR